MSLSKLHGYLSPNQSLSKEQNRIILVAFQREKRWGSNWSLRSSLQFMRHYEVCSIFLVILENSCCSYWNWRSRICFEFEMESQTLNGTWGLTEYLLYQKEFKNSTPIAFYILFLIWPINVHTSAEDQKLMLAMVDYFNIVRQWENTLCTHFIPWLTSLTKA